jgi:hypothetical protein
MKDDNIMSKVRQLKDLISQVNGCLSELEDLNVEVRISYIDSNKTNDVKQGLSLWRIIEHNNYLHDE